MDTNITKDPAYDAADPSDFPAMLDVERYGKRSGAFDKIISATHDHFWDPLDKKYIDFDTPWDLETQAVVPYRFSPELQTAIGERLTEPQKIRFINQVIRFGMSSILHGEQGALALSASLCHILKDPGAQEYAANQTREEARHVTAFAAYIKARWGTPVPVGPALGNLLNEMVSSPFVWKKLVGMQMLVEGLAMGTFATFYTFAEDPVLKRLCQLVMTDEAFHHKFGKIWADRTIPHLSEEERNKIEDWAVQVFLGLLRNIGAPEQKKHIYAEFGIDWKWAQGAMMEGFTDAKLRLRMRESTSVFRVLIKTLLKAGIITGRTRPTYAGFVDMEELHAEGDRMIGDDIAEEGIKYLLQINGGNTDKASLLAAE